MKIFLIGMPGSGKSTIGKLLALKLAIPFVDLDTEIEKREKKLIKEIFKESGEAYFREIESKVLQDCASSPSDFVIATGGGAPCFHEGIRVINAAGISVFLDVPVDELVARVEKEKERPLLLSSDKAELVEKLTTTRSNRIQCYQQANITISNPTIDSVYENLKLRI